MAANRLIATGRAVCLEGEWEFERSLRQLALAIKNDVEERYQNALNAALNTVDNNNDEFNFLLTEEQEDAFQSHLIGLYENIRLEGYTYFSLPGEGPITTRVYTTAAHRMTLTKMGESDLLFNEQHDGASFDRWSVVIENV